MKTHRLPAFTAFLLIASALWANGVPEYEAVELESDASKMGNVEIKTFITADQAWNKIVGEMVTDFQRRYPNLRIVEETITGSQASKLVVMHASGTAPDIHTVSPDSILQFIRGGALMELDGYIAASEEIDWEDLWDVNNEVYRYDGMNFGNGPLYAFIKDWSPDFMMFYNKRIFDNAGVAYPDSENPMTWNEYRQMLSRLSQTDDNGDFTQYATTYDFVPMKQLFQMILINGGRVFNEDGTEFILTEPKTREAIEYWMDLMVGPEKLVPFYEEPTPMWSGDLFKSGKSAVSWFGRWAIPGIFADATNLEYGIAPPPVPEGGERLSTIAGAIGWTMSSTTENPDATWKFLEYLMTEGQVQLADIGFNIPGNKSVAYEKFATESDPQMKEWNELFLEEGEKYTVAFPLSGYVTPEFVMQAMSDEFRKYYDGSISLDVALQNAEDTVNAEIADWTF